MDLPKKGVPRDELFARMRERKDKDADWRAGRTWSLVYPAGEEVDSILHEANELYLYENSPISSSMNSAAQKKRSPSK